MRNSATNKSITGTPRRHVGYPVDYPTSVTSSVSFVAVPSRAGVISRVPACDSSHALSKLCTLACSRDVTVPLTSLKKPCKKLTRTVSRLACLARPRTGPRTGRRAGGDARADPSAVARSMARDSHPAAPCAPLHCRLTPAPRCAFGFYLLLHYSALSGTPNHHFSPLLGVVACHHVISTFFPISESQRLHADQ